MDVMMVFGYPTIPVIMKTCIATSFRIDMYYPYIRNYSAFAP